MSEKDKNIAVLQQEVERLSEEGRNEESSHARALD